MLQTNEKKNKENKSIENITNNKIYFIVLTFWHISLPPSPLLSYNNETAKWISKNWDPYYQHQN